MPFAAVVYSGRCFFHPLALDELSCYSGEKSGKFPKGGAGMDKKQPPVSDNPIVAALPALLSDKKKLRALLAVIGAVFIVILALALITVA